jgi:hypothetical protein
MEPQTISQPVEVKEQKHVLHLVTPLSKYLAMTLFVILPFVGGYIGYTYAPEKVVEVERVVFKEPVTVAQEVSVKTYVDKNNGFQFEYPVATEVVAVDTRQLGAYPEPITIDLPRGSLQVMEQLFISPVPYAQFSEKSPIYDYQSCCTGTRYWYDEIENEWRANVIKVGQFDEAGNEIPDPKVSLKLSEAGVCTLSEVFGTNTFYKVVSGDEAVATQVHYFLLTNKGYALRFTLPYDVRGDYTSYEESLRPSPEMLDAFAQILSSVKLLEGTSATAASCR